MKSHSTVRSAPHQVESLAALRTLVLECPANQKEAADLGAVMVLVQTLFCFADGVPKPRAPAPAAQGSTRR